MKSTCQAVAILLTAWIAGAGCAASPDPEPSSGEAVDPALSPRVPLSPCAGAQNGVYCGQSTQGGFGSMEPGIPGHLYACVAEIDKDEKTCSSSCTVESSGTPDRCNPDPCAHVSSANNGKYCGRSTQSGFGTSNASAFVLYTCTNQRTAASQFCVNGCTVAPAGTADHCN